MKNKNNTNIIKSTKNNININIFKKIADKIDQLTIKEKINYIFYYLIVIVICIVIFLFMQSKEGLHEDEVFSYGSSNYKYDNLFQPYGDMDSTNIMIRENIFKGSLKDIIKKLSYYITHPASYIEKWQELQDAEKPVWKTNKDALEYMSINKNDILNFWSVYYNQSRDTHPPLFYFLVHIVCSFFLGKFSKYYIFIINIILFLALSIVISKLLQLLDKKYLSIPVIILYGLSIGGISTVLFQRMYMLLTLIVFYYIYLNIKFILNNYTMTKELKIKIFLTVLCGFLTQYYFCIYAIITVFILMLFMKKSKEKIKSLLFYYIKIALIGILIFPASIYQIFFSYRGVSNLNNANFNTLDFIKLIFTAYNLNNLIGTIILIGLATIIIIMYKKNKNKFIILFSLPTILFIYFSSKISPYLDLRYIMCVLPIIAMIFWLCLDFIFKDSKKINITIITIIILLFAIYTLINKEPLYLYKGYNKFKEIAKQNSNLKYIYIEDNVFNHIQNIEEFMIYKESYILNTSKDELKYLKNNKKLVNNHEFIVCIKKHLNEKEIIKQILEYTNYSKYEILLNDENLGSALYKIIK